MFCEIVNKAPFSVCVKTSAEERILLPDERDIFRCDGGRLEASLSYMMNSVKGEPCKTDRVERGLRRLISLFSKGLYYDYHIVIDSEYIFTDISHGERFVIADLNNGAASFELIRAPQLVRDMGTPPAEKRLFPRKGDETVAQYKKTVRQICRRSLIVELITEGFIEGTILVLLLLIFGKWSELNWVEQLFWGIMGTVIFVIPLIVIISRYFRDVKHDSIYEFCHNSKHDT